MPFRDVLGQPLAVDLLRRGLAAGKLHHALLFFGPRGVGKELTAFALACAIVCESAPGEGCGVCGACHRVLTRSSEGAEVPLHPDVVIVERALYPKEVLGRSTDEKTDISVDQIRRVVLERIALTPHEAKQRTVIIRACDELSVGAANALLKTLEEPPPHTRFVLMTSRPGELLPTIQSRTQPLRFVPLPDEVVAKVLVARGIDPERAKEVAQLSSGSVEEALDRNDPERFAEQQKAVEALRVAARGSLVDLLDVTSSYPNSGEGRVELARDLAALSALEANEVRTLLQTKPNDVRSIDAAVARFDAAHELSLALEKNANVPLALEAGWLALRRRT